MSIRVAVSGANGKMGQHVVDAVNNDAALELVGQIDHQDDLAQAIQDTKAQVVVDFTTATSAYENTKKIIEAGAHPVIGTTGFTPEQIAELTEKSRALKLGGVIAPNFSIGALLMMTLAAQAAEHMKQVEIIELHHDKKADAPSGTAIKTAELLAAKINPPNNVTEKEMVKGARGGNLNNVHIHSVRLPGFVANQQVIFGGLGETFTLKHETISREAFMPGVVLACKKVLEVDTLIYGLEHFLFD